MSITQRSKVVFSSRFHQTNSKWLNFIFHIILFMAKVQYKKICWQSQYEIGFKFISCLNMIVSLIPYVTLHESEQNSKYC